MAEIRPSWDDSKGITMSLSQREAVYVLACLGASNASLFELESALDNPGRRETLYSELKEALGVQKVADATDEQANEQTKLFRQLSEVLDAWCGRRNYIAARRVAQEYGL